MSPGRHVGSDASDGYPGTEEGLQAILDALPALVGFWDSDLRNRLANEAYMTYFGLSAEEVRGKHIREVLGEDIYEQNRPYIEGALAGRPQLFDRAIPLASGEVRYTQASYVPHVVDGETRGFSVLVTDITERRRAEERLAEEEQRFRTLFASAPVATFLIDRRQSMVDVNPAGAVLLGRPIHDLLGDALLDAVLEEERGEVSAGFERLWTGEAAALQLDARLRSPAVATLWVQLDATLLPGGHRGDTYCLVQIQDVSARHQHERDLQQELNQARRLESVGQLAGGIAHDFNNLLGVIINSADFAADALPPDSPAAPDIEAIRDASQRAANLTRQLLIFSRRDVVQTETLLLDELVRELTPLLVRALGARIELTIETDEHLWAVDADRGQMEQVIVNLAINARDAMPSGGRLEIELTNAELDGQGAAIRAGLPPGRYVRLTVRDSGTGMSHDVLEHAFEPFYTSKPKGQGTGLGLSTVYGIVTEAGGHVDLASEPGAGTTVQIHLPARVAAPGDGAEQRQAPTIAGRGQTVLVVEDEDAVRAMTVRILTSAGYEVLAAADGPAALRLARDAHIDLLLTDVIMPAMTGPELAAEFRSEHGHAKTLFMSGYSHEVLDGDTLADKRTTAFVNKPFTADELLSNIHELLDAPPQSP